MNMKDTQFDFLLPIGAACQTRYQIERFLREFYGVTQPACFFDWIGIGGILGVVKIIESDFKLNEKDFIIKSLFKKNHYTPIHAPSGFRFQHDFGSTVETKKNEQLAINTMMENMADTLSKYAYLGKRTLDILSSGQTIGLVYHGKIKEEHALLLQKTLNEYFNNSVFYIINIMNEENKSPLNIPNILNLSVDNISVKGKATEWQGDDSSWNNALSKIVINPELLYEKIKHGL